jgi:hypothetical protein
MASIARRRVLAAVVAVFLASGFASSNGARAAESDLEIYEAFVALFDGGALRNILNLPQDRLWRIEGGLLIAPFADDPAALQPLLDGLAGDFAAVTGRPIDVAAFRPLADAPAGAGQPIDNTFRLDLVFGARVQLSAWGAELGIGPRFRERFEGGLSPFLFHFERVRQRGWVLIAEDEPGAVFDAAAALAVVWALGGATLGSELDGLIVPGGAGPRLTETGKGAFALLYHPELKHGMDLSAALARARALAPATR